MSIIKSLSVGDGDLYYIVHNSASFTIIDCNIFEDNALRILKELDDRVTDVYKRDGVYRFISTHPDEDHIRGIERLRDIVNFYCVENSVNKTEESDSLKKYKLLRDSDRCCFLKKGLSRKWLNQADDTHGSAGISVLWPIVDDPDYKAELNEANKIDGRPNNISPILKYSAEDGVVAIWMGDMQTDFMEKIIDRVVLPEVDIFFAPHHGRDSGRPPKDWLDAMNPSVIVIGEADSEYLNYYEGWNTITQNTAGDILFDCDGGVVNCHVSKAGYSAGFLKDKGCDNLSGMKYIGSFSCKKR